MYCSLCGTDIGEKLGLCPACEHKRTDRQQQRLSQFGAKHNSTTVSTATRAVTNSFGRVAKWIGGVCLTLLFLIVWKLLLAGAHFGFDVATYDSEDYGYKVFQISEHQAFEVSFDPWPLQAGQLAEIYSDWEGNSFEYRLTDATGTVSSWNYFMQQTENDEGEIYKYYQTQFLPSAGSNLLQFRVTDANGNPIETKPWEIEIE